MRLRLLCLFLLISVATANAQVVYQHIQNTTIYEFLDEMATMQLLDINTAVKPYSRRFIAEQLVSLTEQQASLNKRQQGELDFFLRDYNKELVRYKEDFDKRFDLFYYADSTFTLSTNLILGLTLSTEPSALHRWYGADVFSYLGKNVGAYVSFRDNYENAFFTAPSYLDQRMGGALRVNRADGIQEYSEVRGGLTYAWKWGAVGLVQDHFVWGNNYNGSNIFSGRTPSLPQLKIQVKPTRWLEFNSVHAWLNSNLVDSVNTYNFFRNSERIIYRQKYISANLVTVSPFPQLYVSFGNSTVYGDVDVQPSYLIPFFFHRSLDHDLSNNRNNAGSNSQLFFDISSRNIKNTHLFATLFIEELNLSKLFSDNNKNQVGFKLGGRVANLLGGNVSIMGEYTHTRPAVYRHYLPITEFTSSNYNLGHYLGENAEELYAAIVFKPLARLHTTLFFSNARKGANTFFGAGNSQGDLPFIEEVIFEHQQFGLEANYEIFNDMHLNLRIIRSDLQDETGRFAPDFWKGETTQIFISGNWGF